MAIPTTADTTAVMVFAMLAPLSNLPFTAGNVIGLKSREVMIDLELPPLIAWDPYVESDGELDE